MTVSTQEPIQDKEKIVQNNTEQENKTVVQDPQKTEPANETPEERNWKRFRQERERERREKAEAERRAAEKEKEAAALKAALEAVVNRPVNTQQYQEPQELSEEERIRKIVQETVMAAERKRAEDQARREAEEMPNKLNQICPNFAEVTAQENIDYLEYHHKELFESLKDTPDSIKKWVNVYNAIKKYVPVYDSKKDEKRIEQNSSKPQSISVPGMTNSRDVAPIKLDDKRRNDNWSRMQRVMKGMK